MRKMGICLLFHGVVLILLLQVYHCGGSSKSYLRLVKPPVQVRPGTELKVEYMCMNESEAGLFITANTGLQDRALLFQASWPCTDLGTAVTRLVNVTLPDSLSYAPGHGHRAPLTVTSARLHGWILDAERYDARRASVGRCYAASQSRAAVAVKVAPPYERPARPSRHCDSWWRAVWTALPYTPRCPLELEVYPLVSYPVTMLGDQQGVHRQMAQYGNKELERARRRDVHTPRLAVSVWLYVVEYCPLEWSLCSIVQRITWDDLYLTPIVYLNKHGHVHIQSADVDKEPTAFITAWRIPTDTWCHLIVTLNGRRWSVDLQYGEKEHEYYATNFDIPDTHAPYNNDTDGLWIVGGSEVTPTFKGFVGEATLYRNHARFATEMVRPSPYAPLFELRLAERGERCVTFMRLIEHTVHASTLLRRALRNKKSCPANLRDLVLGWRPVLPLRGSDQCSILGPRQGRLAAVTWVRRRILEGRDLDLQDMGRWLYDNVTSAIAAGGLAAMRDHVLPLRQASCYGYAPASYMLSVILNDGVAVRADGIQSHAYLMAAALTGDRLSVLALGHKHEMGLGVPRDLELAYNYYKYVASRTRADKDLHREDDVWTDTVRLTNDWELREQTSEDGHLFLWFKHQALNGEVDAQRTMGRLLFWGSQGVKRNLKAAAEYYRKSAEDEDPAALFDYGIVLLRGQGVEKNVTKAIEILERSSQLGHIPATNAVGWYHLAHTRNYTRAHELFVISHRARNPDAAFNLAHMYLTGLAPGLAGKPDKAGALTYIHAGAVLGQQDCAVLYAMYNIRGHPHLPRNPVDAVEWARYVAESNPAVGKALAEGLSAYRDENWPDSLLKYLLAAHAGPEVATFNTAYLCEENKDYISTYMQKECVYRFYNLSTQHLSHYVESYASIKMGDYYWAGHGGRRDARQAVRHYAAAAYKGDPHGMFNLGFLVEQNVHVPNAIWDGLGISRQYQAHNLSLLVELYSRCRESWQREAYIPCSLAYMSVLARYCWHTYHLLIKVVLVVVGGVAVVGVGPSLAARLARAAPVMQV